MSRPDDRWIWPDGTITDAQKTVLGTTADINQAARELFAHGPTPSITWTGNPVRYVPEIPPPQPPTAPPIAPTYQPPGGGNAPATGPTATVVTTGPSNMMAPDTQLYVLPQDAAPVTPSLPANPTPPPAKPVYGVTPYPGAGPTNDLNQPAEPTPTTEPASSSGLTSPLLIGLALLGGYAIFKGKNRRREF